jgi:hypothetical protein
MGRHIKTESDLSSEEKICLHGYFVDASMLGRMLQSLPP